MIQKNTILLSVLLSQALLVASADAVVLASTNFDSRTLTTTLVANDTATDLNWTLNGLENPGDMAALSAGVSGLAIFNNTATTQVLFAPLLNTGNGNTFWTTTIDLTVVAGSNVTLTDVAFDYWAINGGGALNVGRRSDFTISLFNPSANLVDSVDIVDASGGSDVSPNVPTLTATFAAPISLSLPGTYTLQIKGGDYLVFNETGNHTAIDNLSINGTVTPVPEPSALFLTGLGLLALVRRRR